MVKRKQKKAKVQAALVRDFRVTGLGGSVVLVQPLTDTTRTWIADNVQEPMWLGSYLAVEARFVADLVNGMIESGLVADGLAARSLARGES